MNNILITSVKDLMLRELSKLKQEISSYNTEGSIWKLEGDIKNTAGNLCLHLCGNLQHFIGTVLGKSGYVRNREVEFSVKNISRELLIKEIEATINIVEITLSKLNPATVEQTYPEEVLGKPMTTGFFLIHLAAHLDYHLGQVNYHRRLIG